MMKTAFLTIAFFATVATAKLNEPVPWGFEEARNPYSYGAVSRSYVYESIKNYVGGKKKSKGGYYEGKGGKGYYSKGKGGKGYYYDDDDMGGEGYYYDDNDMGGKGYYYDDNDMGGKGYYYDDDDMGGKGYYYDDDMDGKGGKGYEKGDEGKGYYGKGYDCYEVYIGKGKGKKGKKKGGKKKGYGYGKGRRVICKPAPSKTNQPTVTPTPSPTASPTGSPTVSPTVSPTQSPTKSPTSSPTVSPTISPTQSPTNSPTSPPSMPDSFTDKCMDFNSLTGASVEIPLYQTCLTDNKVCCTETSGLAACLECKDCAPYNQVPPQCCNGISEDGCLDERASICCKGEGETFFCQQDMSSLGDDEKSKCPTEPE